MQPSRNIRGRDTYRYKDVEKVLQCGKLRDELLDNFTEGLEDRVIIYTGQIETAEDREREKKRALDRMTYETSNRFNTANTPNSHFTIISTMIENAV